MLAEAALEDGLIGMSKIYHSMTLLTFSTAPLSKSLQAPHFKLERSPAIWSQILM